jgi:energy-coupling factor transporter ATP-binding protein EcfA2
MHQRIIPRWKTKTAQVRAAFEAKKAETAATLDETARAALLEKAGKLEAQTQWLSETIVEIIISEAQNEVADFKKWNFDIIPHRARMKKGFEIDGGERVDVETAFKNPNHQFRVAIVCAMWLTGFDVECLSTLYINKPMKAHTLMQAIARANRVYPGKDFGLIVDYNGMLASLRAALAQYALGDDGTVEDRALHKRSRAPRDFLLGRAGFRVFENRLERLRPDARARMSVVDMECRARGIRARIQDLVRRVKEHNFVAVVGPSGSGKSSLVFAGLLPALRGQGRTTMWDVVTLRPGKSPLRALAEAFWTAPESTGPAEIVARLEREATFYGEGTAETLVGIVDRRLEAAPEKPDRLLIYVDQWEELYAMAPPPEDKEHVKQHSADVQTFIELLVAASSGSGSRANVVMTVRGEIRRRPDRAQGLR